MSERVDALAELTSVVAEHEPGLAHFAAGCLAMRGQRPTRADIEDALSDAFVTAAIRLRREPHLTIERPLAWFKKIVFFRCLHMAAAAKSRRWVTLVSQLEIDDVLLDSVRDGARGPGIETRLTIEALLDGLDGRSKEVLRLYAEGFTSTEIAEQLGETADNVRQLKSRTLRSLRERASWRHYEDRGDKS
jgi:RNA polymerase sigma factor (sigma-70 family)